MSHRFLEVDVFATGLLSGNPLAVVADAHDLSDDEMRRIAAWTNFSETTFLLPPTDPEADYRVRIFTPSTEYPFAGHPTVGSARAFLHLGGVPRRDGVLVQECGAGLVPVRVEDDRLAFATPPRTRSGPLSDADVARITDVLGTEPEQVVAHEWGVNGPEWAMVQLPDADAVRALRPAARPGMRIGVVGLEQPGQQAAYEVRAFGDGYEDPVTGSLNGAVAQWLRGRRLVPGCYVAHQGSQMGRAGRIHVTDDGTDIWIGGLANVMVDGQLRLG